MVDIVNSIFWNDSPDEIASNTADVSFSDIKGYIEGEQNLHIYPQFVDADNGDLRLLEGSPCIDAGSVDVAPAEDIDGNKRFNADIGAYEYVE